LKAENLSTKKLHWYVFKCRVEWERKMIMNCAGAVIWKEAVVAKE
jgi:hypothetical protein